MRSSQLVIPVAICTSRVIYNNTPSGTLVSLVISFAANPLSRSRRVVGGLCPPQGDRSLI